MDGWFTRLKFWDTEISKNDICIFDCLVFDILDFFNFQVPTATTVPAIAEAIQDRVPSIYDPYELKFQVSESMISFVEFGISPRPFCDTFESFSSSFSPIKHEGFFSWKMSKTPIALRCFI